MKCVVSLSALATILPRLLLAQATAYAPDQRRFFVDFRCGYSICEIRYQTTNGTVSMDTPMFKDGPFSTIPFTIGYYLTPRLAVQLGGAYGRTSEESGGGTMQTPTGTYVIGSKHETRRPWGVPVLLRYAVLPKKWHLQLDALLGLMRASDSYEVYSYSTFNGAITSDQTRGDHGSQFIGTAGIGVRYAFGRHFELHYDHAWNRNLDGAPPYIRQQITGNEYGLTENRTLSLRYRFNWGKPTSPPTATE